MRRATRFGHKSVFGSKQKANSSQRNVRTSSRRKGVVLKTEYRVGPRDRGCFIEKVGNCRHARVAPLGGFVFRDRNDFTGQWPWQLTHTVVNSPLDTLVSGRFASLAPSTTRFFHLPVKRTNSTVKTGSIAGKRCVRSDEMIAR